MNSKAAKKKDLEKKKRIEEMHRIAIEVIRERALVFLLWLFSKREMHGYELIRVLKQEQMLRISPKPAMVYPMLNALCKRGLLSCRVIKEGKREKKLYKTSEKGMEYIEMAKREYEKNKLLRGFVKEVVL